MSINVMPIIAKDFYKTDHRRQYPEGTTKIYSNLTPRITRDPYLNFGCVVFGVQGFIEEYLVNNFKHFFFDQDKSEAISRYKRRMDFSLGKDTIPTDHLEALHDLGYLPLHIKALPEGSVSPLKTPVLTITNTHPNFAWVPNFLETLISAELWPMMQSATIAFAYRKMLTKYARLTSSAPDFVLWQGHDFSMRGHRGLDAAIKSGAAHLTSFTGTDTIPAIDYLEEFYQANAEREIIGGSVPATEHSVMCMGGLETEEETYRRLLNEVYPKGIVSIVSDTWDFWRVLTETLPKLKEVIMKREGKLVVRPDSGCPVKILCGDPEAPKYSPAFKGAVECLYEVFGGKLNHKGYLELDPHIGLIYGDSITLERCEKICHLLKEKGFASTNVVFGIGSYTYQYNTRDTLGFAMKATYGEILGKPQILFKAPKTDDGQKNSARGLLRVNEDLTLSENVSPEEERGGVLQTVFLNGQTPQASTLAEIRARINKYLEQDNG